MNENTELIWIFSPNLGCYDLEGSADGYYFLYEPTVNYFARLAAVTSETHRFPIEIDIYMTPEVQSMQFQYVSYNNRAPIFMVADRNAAIQHAEQLQGGVPARFRVSFCSEYNRNLVINVFFIFDFILIFYIEIEGLKILI